MIKPSESEHDLRLKIDELIEKFYALKKSDVEFIPGKSKVNYAAAVYDDNEIKSMITALLDGWFGMSKNALRFENDFKNYLGVKKAIFVNSGSSANLLTIAPFFSAQLKKDERWSIGDEIITPAMTFPTTLNPIIQHNLKPVLLDVELGTYNMNLENLEDAISKNTKAIFIPHTLGNPNDMGYIMELAQKYDLRVIEDACDALGGKYNGGNLGTFGDFGTFSFYPAHHITTGEGGMVVTNSEELSNIVQSLRDWGRACVIHICEPIKCGDSECPRALKNQSTGLEGLPEDYDKRYSYTNIGYNLKPIELQGAMGREQLKRLPGFIKKRNAHFRILFEDFQKYEDYFILPKWLKNSEPSWFAFPLTIKKNAKFKRKDIMEWYLKNNIEAKLLFSGNIIQHPAYRDFEFKIAEPITNSEYCMHNAFFLGVYPGLSEEKLNFVIAKTKEFLSKY